MKQSSVAGLHTLVKSFVTVAVMVKNKRTRHSHMILYEADVLLGVLRQLIEASSSRGVAVPAGQRLVLNLNALQHLLIGWHRPMRTKMGKRHYYAINLPAESVQLLCGNRSITVRKRT